MSDEIKTDAEKVIADTQATIAELESGEVRAAGWVKTHTLIAAVLGAFILGAIAGAVIVAHL